jgi:UDP-N-acetylmuramyl pentapeptide phosphotransferase/UDP-N-acetylglucosamine-1-phosphate transferase
MMTLSVDNWYLAGAAGFLAVIAAVASAGLCVLLHPLLARYALARPSARSSHREGTPQGGGIAVIAAMMFALLCAVLFFPNLLSVSRSLIALLTATMGLAVVGVTDDIRPLDVTPRILLQGLAVAITIAVLPAEFRVVHVFPWWLERALLVVGGIWFVNLVNFMDGIDWMTVAEVVPLTAGLSLFGLLGVLPWDATLVSLTLCGAIIGFAPFNRPVARLFLGDVGSLPIGLLLGWLLTLLAAGGHLAAALLLPLYYLADATITLLRRLANGESVVQAHRSHFYQRAMDNGFSVYQIVGRVFAVNVVLVALATVTVLYASVTLHSAALAAGSVAVATLLWIFTRVRR